MGESRTPVETRRFRVAGLGNADCVARVEQALLSVPGVEKAIVDFAHQEAVIRVADYIADQLLAEAVYAAGYTLVLAPQNTINGEFDPDPAPEAPYEPALRQAQPRTWPRINWQTAWFIASRTALYGFIASILITLAYRFVPVPTTMLMLSDALFEQRTIHNDWLPLRQVSPNLIRAVIASEDNEFCRHWGFDFAELEDAWRESRNGGRLRGASTISQQTAKNVFLWPGRSWIRKGLEAYFTVLIETLWPKQRIMEVYLNVIEWGPGVFGADAASRKWFGKSASRLTQLEAARLAAILPNPNHYRANPPGPYVNSRGYTISARANSVDLNGADRCARP